LRHSSEGSGLASSLSSAAAWYLFIPPSLEQKEAFSLLLFCFIAGIDVTIIALLNAAVDRVIAQEENIWVVVESAPNGILVVDKQGNITLVNASTEKLFDYERSELLGNDVEVLVPTRRDVDSFV
jgi:PAS domain-containing protein